MGPVVQDRRPSVAKLESEKAREVCKRAVEEAAEEYNDELKANKSAGTVNRA
ncbi:hypothetical protein LTR36_000911 [Oleoguttula mirabilis]|uniref:Uncharacterized protein n=1 Tax=Oleoguttula mirabilis TaxID=1507867 RepID=A0AAV9JPA0_9PEZI|nr:hypothetical protein LTR36_000911 [Oleoguttula mirabilis]